MISGFIVTEPPVMYNGHLYRGVDSNPWPIDFGDCECFSKNEITLLENRAWESLLADIPFLINKTQKDKYISECIAKHIDYQCYYCDCFDLSDVKNYSFEEQNTFLGFDYAYPAEDYYSCIVMDILLRPQLLNGISLVNSNGLIKDKEALLEFIERRSSKSKEEKQGVFEVGTFWIYSFFLETQF